MVDTIYGSRSIEGCEKQRHQNYAYRQLCATVLNKAISDRREAIHKLSTNPENEKGKELLWDCDSFFRGEWCSLMLTFLDIEREKFMEVVYGR